LSLTSLASPNSNIDPIEPLAIREIQGSSSVASYGTVQSASSLIFVFITLSFH